MKKSKADQISELFVLFKSGTLTKEEFELLKSRVIQEGHFEDPKGKSFIGSQINPAENRQSEDTKHESTEEVSHPLKSTEINIEGKEFPHTQNETKTQKGQNEGKRQHKKRSIKRRILLFIGLVILGFFIFTMVYDEGSISLLKDRNKNEQSDSTEQQKKVRSDITNDGYLKAGSLNEIINHSLTGYTILEYKEGDLNRDALPDLIVVYKQTDEENIKGNNPNDPVYRPTLLYTRTSEGKLNLRATNKKVVYCHDCGGLLGDPFHRVVINNGFFTFEHSGGAGYRWTRFITFRYSEQMDNWTLHRDGGVVHHRSDPESVTNYMYTRDDFGQILFEEFDIYNSDYYLQ